jgi:hypothetical protein
MAWPIDGKEKSPTKGVKQRRVRRVDRIDRPLVVVRRRALEYSCRECIDEADVRAKSPPLSHLLELLARIPQGKRRGGCLGQ